MTIKPCPLSEHPLEEIKRYSFNSHLDKQRADKANSDLQNLATAWSSLEAMVAEIVALQHKIRDAAHNIERGDYVPHETVRGLYDQARKLGTTI